MSLVFNTLNSTIYAVATDQSQDEKPLKRLKG